jgi:hypothetical protein
LPVFQNCILISCCIHFHPRCSGLTTAIIFMNDNSLIPYTMSDMLHCHYTVTIQLCRLPVNFEGGKHPSPMKTKWHYIFLCRSKSPMSLPLQMSLSPE